MLYTRDQAFFTPLTTPLVLPVDAIIMQDDDYEPSDAENFSTPKRSNKRDLSKPNKPKKAKKRTKHEKDSRLRRNAAKLTKDLEDAQAEIAGLTKQLEEAKGYKQAAENAEFQLKNAKVGGIDPEAVAKLQKELDEAKETVQRKEKALKDLSDTTAQYLGEFNDVTPGKEEPKLELPWEKGLYRWTRLELIQGNRELHRESSEWRELAIAEGQKATKLQEVLRKKGLTHASEMNKELFDLAKTMIKEIVSRKYKLLFPTIEAGKPGSLRTMHQAVYSELKTYNKVLEHEEYHPCFEEFERIYGKLLWDYFKDVRQQVQTKCFQSVYGKFVLFKGVVH